MSRTHGGGNAVSFDWQLSGDALEIFKTSDPSYRNYTRNDLIQACRWLFSTFGQGWFPLANNVQLLGNGTEQNGLGVALYRIHPNTAYGQGASYVGVVLEELGLLEWNGAINGICWRFTVCLECVEQVLMNAQVSSLPPHPFINNLAGRTNDNP